MARAFFFQKVKGKLPSLKLDFWHETQIWFENKFSINTGKYQMEISHSILIILWTKVKMDIVLCTSRILITNTVKFTKKILIRLAKMHQETMRIQNRKETNTAILVIFLLMDSSWEQVESSADSSQSPRPHICIILHSQPLIGFFVEKIYIFSLFLLLQFWVLCLKLIWCYELYHET